MLTLEDPLRRACRIGADRPAVVCGDDKLTFAELRDRSARLLRGVRGLGVRRGDRVASVTANCHRFLELYQALPAGGVTVVPLNTRYAEPELRQALAASGCRVVFTDRDPSTLADMVDHVITMPGGYEALLDRTGAGGHDESVAGTGEGGNAAGEDDVAVLYFTGGTTGVPKGVMLTHRNLLANATHLIVSSGLGPEDSWLVMAPPYHVSGTWALLATVWVGARHVVQPAFEPRAALDLLATHQVTATLGVPTMLAAMAREQLERPRDVASLRYLAHAGAPIATETVRLLHTAFPAAELVQFYGATETGPIATVLRNEQQHLDSPRARSCGVPVIGVDVQITDPDGRPLPANQVGEVTVGGPNIMKGYLDQPDHTRAVLRDGWFRTGDLGYVDEQAYLYLVDRSKDMIITGGENVYSTEVEDVLYAHPDVLEAAVFGIPDPRWGEAVHALVVARAPVDAETLREFCRARIAGYKIPKIIELRTEPLPKSGAGKILKHRLREPYWADHRTRVNG